MKTGEKKYQEFLNKYAANSERLRKVGINPFGYNPGYLCNIKDVYASVDLPNTLVEIICDLIKKVYPETVDDKKMIKKYKKRSRETAKKINEDNKKLRKNKITTK